MQNSKNSLPAFHLPDSRYNWRVKVTSVVKADTLFVRFCDYEEEYKEMVKQMKYFYFMSPQRVACVVKDGLYVAISTTKAARIRVKDINNDNISSYFVDHGFTRNLKINALHEINGDFTKLPAQAFELMLSLVEEGDDEKAFVSKIVDERVDKVFFAKLISRIHNKFVVELYFDVAFDLLGDENCLNVALNRLIRRKAIEQLLSVKDSYVDVYVTYCVIKNDECLVSIQVDDENLKTLNANQEQVNYYCERFGTSLQDNCINYDCVYYVKSSEVWRRIKIICNDEYSVTAFFVDYGYTDFVSLQEIRKIDEYMDPNRFLPSLVCSVCLLPKNEPWNATDALILMKFFSENIALMRVVEVANEKRIHAVVQLFKPAICMLNENPTLKSVTCCRENIGGTHLKDFNSELNLNDDYKIEKVNNKEFFGIKGSDH